MAKEKQVREPGVVIGEDGVQALRKLEERRLSDMLELYAARIEAYRFTEYDEYVHVDMKIAFPTASNENNVRIWAFFIAEATHTSTYNTKTSVYPEATGLVAYVAWNISKNVKFIESKHKGDTRF